MLRTWLSQLRKQFRGGSCGSRSTYRRQPPARLKVEALEERQMLSGNTAGYLLNAGGNLYQQTTSGLVLRDTGVKDFTAPAGTLYDLHTDGRVVRFFPGGYSSQIYSNAAALVSDTAGFVFALNSTDNAVYENYGGTSWSSQGYNFGALVSNSQGNVLALGLSDQTVYQHVLGAGNSWNRARGSISSLVVDATGNVFALNFGGSVLENVPGALSNWNTVGSSTANLVSDATGNVFGRTFDGTIYEHQLRAGFGWDTVGQTASSLVSDATGNVFALYWDGSVYEHNSGTSWSWNPVGSSTASLVSDVTGNIFGLTFDGTIFEHQLGAGYGWNTVGSSTASLVRDATGNIFSRTFDGTIYEHQLGGGYGWNTVGQTATSLVSDATGNVFALYSNGMIYEHNPGTGWSWSTVGQTGSCLVQDATGNVFALYSDGTIYEHNQGAGYSWTTVGGNTSTLVSDATGNVFGLANDHNVYEHTQGNGYSWNTVASNTSRLSGCAAGSLFTLGFDGTLSVDQVGAWQTLSRLVYSFSVTPAGSWSITSDWFSQNLSDPGMQTLCRTDYNRDVSITRADMLGLFFQAKSNGMVSAEKFHDLQAIVASSGTLAIPPDVTNLAGKVVNGDPANGNYHYLDSSGVVQTVALGNLHANSSNSQMTQLTNKWFCGGNYPMADAGHTYTPVGSAVPLTAGGFHYYDVTQNQVGDCWLMASLAELAARAPGYLQSMFTYDGTNKVNGATVGVWTVRFFHNGVADYVTVDTELPDGGFHYANIMSTNPNGTTSTELWVALAEKAYAQENESGWIGTGSQGTNSYQALSGGWPAWALPALTGLNTTDVDVNGNNLASAWNSGKLVCLCTASRTFIGPIKLAGPSSDFIVGGHCYALVGYDPSSSVFTVYNPWGLPGGIDSGTNHQCWGQFTATASFLASNFNKVTTTAAIPSASEHVPVRPPDFLGQHAKEAEVPVFVPSEVRQTEHRDAIFAAPQHRRDDRVLAMCAAVAGHSQHDHAISDQVFAEADGDAWSRC